jgi:chaperonin GroEL (HSP60 family)
MVREALTLAGFRGRIIVEKTLSMTPSVELVRGYTFDVRLGFPIDFSVANPRIACVDGFIESVSEVHHLLEAAATSREPCVFFVRGLTDDVIHTLRVNHDRGTLRVFPAIVPFDLDGMNTLVDVAVVSGSDVVSSLKGELISSIDFHRLPIVERVTSFKGNTVIMESRTAQAVRSHVARLRSRRVDEGVDEVGKLLDRRIRSLSPNHVVIRLPEGRDFVVNSQAVDLSLRTVRSCVERGMGEDGEPALSRPIAMIHAQRCRSTLTSLGAAIV